MRKSPSPLTTKTIKTTSKRRHETKKQAQIALTYEQMEKLAQQYYNEGGDIFVECWDKKDYEEDTKQFGAWTVRKAIDMFHTWDSIYRDRACDW